MSTERTCRCPCDGIGIQKSVRRKGRKRRRSYPGCQRMLARPTEHIVPLLLIVLVTNASLLKFDAAATTVLAFTAAPPSSNGRSGIKQGYGTNALGIKDMRSNWVLSKGRGVPILARRYRQLSATNSVDNDAGAGAGADVKSTSSDDTGINNGVDQQTNGLDVTRGATLAPYHILQPDAFPWQNQNGLQVDGSDEIVMSLNSALRILTKALTKMIDEVREYDGKGGGKVVGSAVADLLDQYCTERVPTSSASHGPVVLRIEQILSHEVDPLRWLHANSKCVEYREPIAFFADADGEREAASIGSSLTLTDLVFGEGNTSGSWRTVSALPPRAEFYGGSRFDSYDENDNRGRRQGSEWQAFGNERWLLPSVELRSYPKKKQSILAAQVVFHPGANCTEDLRRSIHKALGVLQNLSDATSPKMAPTDLPPVVRRDYNVGGEDGDGQEAFERGVTAALKAFEDDGYRIIGKEGSTGDDEECDIGTDESSEQNLCIDLQKVVLARRADLHVGSLLSGLDLLMALKFGGHKGHLLYLRPPSNDIVVDVENAAEFVGCSPERLFRVSADESNGHTVQTEALAGTRPRGSTPQADRQLLQDLITSEKDRSENVITGDFIEEVFDDMVGLGLLRGQEEETAVSRNADENKIFGNIQQKDENMFFVRRLRQLQHICRLFEGRLAEDARPSDAICHLLQNLHPTPALNGYPSAAALEFIRKFESTPSFDRGYYGGPFGYVGKDAADVSVAIRSALLTGISTKKSSGTSSDRQNHGMSADMGSTRVSIYAGAGIVPGSTVESEWAETSQKLGVLSSIFPPSPITLQESPTPNVAWATAFVEELIRNGVTQFYVCPGSRSTPLTSALAKATRSRIGSVHAISVHDERGAAFRALGYGRRTGRPAAVVTSSGTAVANLYPAVVEAGMDGVPMLLLTADRPYESRDTGANQAVDQVKAFSSSYTRWFRDILPPSDDVPISLVLSDANHAVTLSQSQMGPVHLNIQFRENLAPDTGAIRNDDRVGSITTFNSGRFTDAPAFQRWSVGGGRWSSSYYSSDVAASVSNEAAVDDVSTLIQTVKRGIIVVGNVRSGSLDSVEEIISDFAQYVGYPIFAGIQGGHLRSICPSVVPYGEHILKHPGVSQGIQADFVLQIGAPLISTEIGKVVSECVAKGGSHVLVHPHHPTERADPGFTVTHRVSSEAGSFLRTVQQRLESKGLPKGTLTSDLAPLVLLGRALGGKMPGIIHKASSDIVAQQTGAENDVFLTEPQVALAISEVMQEEQSDATSTKSALFLSNSMPVRDAEFFLYPKSIGGSSPSSVAVNRGASGIDGIISSAAGYADSSEDPTTLVVGDLASLHDLNAFHTLARTSSPTQQPHSPSSSSHSPPLTTVIVNNDGGGIFSFLPIAKYGNDVGFEDFFGTPTHSFSFDHAAKAFGLPYSGASSFDSFKKSYAKAVEAGSPSIVEARVVGRDTNVAVHTEITRLAKQFIDAFLEGAARDGSAAGDIAHQSLPIKVHQMEDVEIKTTKRKTLLLLHGWMGEKEEWDEVSTALSKQLSDEWKVIAIDLPGHGESPLLLSESHHAVRSALGVEIDVQHVDLSIDGLAAAVLTSLKRDHGIDEVDAVCGYSLGGRVALAMRRAFDRGEKGSSQMSIVSEQTKMLLLSAYPGSLPVSDLGIETKEAENSERTAKDDILAHNVDALWMASQLARQNDKYVSSMWSDLLARWYGAKLWGDFRNRKYEEYVKMTTRRARSLGRRGPDLAIVLRACSPPRNPDSDWSNAISSRTLFMAGELDAKYSAIGNQWQEQCPRLSYVKVPNSGHALLIDAAEEVTSTLATFISKTVETSEEEEEQESLISPPKMISPPASSEILENTKDQTMMSRVSKSLPTLLPKVPVEVGTLDYESFSIEFQSNDGRTKGAFGIGWGDRAKPKAENGLSERRGLIINLSSRDGELVGIGEISPLDGLHPETFEEAETLLKLFRKRLIVASQQESLPIIDAENILRLDGALSSFIDSLFGSLGMVNGPQGERFAPLQSVRSGMEMAVLSLASQACSTPLPQALATYSPDSSDTPMISPSKLLPINGIVTRESAVGRRSAIRGSDSRSGESSTISYPSVKVKVGHRHSKEDANALVQSLSTVSSFSIDDSTGKRAGGVRADANRAWDEEGVLEFVSALGRIDPDVIDRIEFIEEPLQRVGEFSQQVKSLEELYKITGIRYALDESIAELAEMNGYNFGPIADAIREAFVSQGRAFGCSALVLKPALLGIELSMQLARMAHNELGIGAVFSSSFDSGIGLAYVSFLASISDGLPSANTLNKYPHGLGTFGMLNGDTLSPAFKSYVKMDGALQVAMLGRALYGLGLDDLRDLIGPQGGFEEDRNEIEEREGLAINRAKEDATAIQQTNQYQAKASTSNTGREISVEVSLPLPFSDAIACARFGDLPQQSRWSPWLNSVAYLDAGGETEWTLNVRGVQYRWRAISKILDNPRGIMWESVSGLKNKGVVEFLPTSEDECVMKVTMTIKTPRVLASVFRGTSSFVEEFLQNKLLKWSLESFRDVVKADLALERGDVELGDALFGAVEGKMSAIEATLSYPENKRPKQDDGSEEKQPEDE